MHPEVKKAVYIKPVHHAPMTPEGKPLPIDKFQGMRLSWTRFGSCRAAADFSIVGGLWDWNRFD
jgi:hypothetical protein